MMNLAFSYLPLILLITLMVKKNPMPSSKALPLSALVAYIVVLLIFKQDARLVNANVISGALLALTPLSIIAGAIFLFKCMEITGALAILRKSLDGVSENPVAQLMIVGWAFMFLIEGASGFGTPAAIAAPILYSLGFPALRVALFCLVLNTIPVTFGAMGTPVWFGLSLLQLPQESVREIAQQAALINTIAAPVIVILALRLVVSDAADIKKNLLFILLSTCACTLPYLGLSYFGVEFPSLLGGLIGLIITLLLAKYKIGIEAVNRPTANRTVSTEQAPAKTVPLKTLIKAAFPLWGTVLLLVLTRLPELGLKALLQATEPALHISLGFLGTFHISTSLVASLTDILNTAVTWKHSVLYIPSIIPFAVTGSVTLWLFRQQAEPNTLKTAGQQTLARMRTPFFAMLGALIFVNMMMLGDSSGQNSAAVAQIGHHLAQITGENWTFFAPLLGALGSFFSGSATISNLTFAGIQTTIAEQLSLPLTTILALQSVGAAMGNMVCINNIVAVTAILGLQNRDGDILKSTVVVMVVFSFIAGCLGVLLVNLFAT
ncbi:putative L-lactate permease [Alteromonas sp. 38]|uniref:L-lactate permease n=1 Tax=unclassified Alteromonas TaxID=2614992 RepID=UPI0012F42FF6|nr:MULTISPECIES: L-lactate permease [unclassified Alteromonas]CAD5256077.1 putative L-lactate permease [Alteromonas sp. 154]VXA95118.1 putative L-lactate permease [Alteromonas sp. 38]